jgi:peroxiredoxin Q/BCP
MTSPQGNYRELRVGDRAPAFVLPAVPAGTVSLADLLGTHNALLFFYYRDFARDATFDDIMVGDAVSLSALSAEADAFSAAGTRVAAICRAPIDHHAALSTMLELRIPLLSDESGDVGQAYGLLPENRWAGASHTYDVDGSVFLVDSAGVVRFKAAPDVILSPDHPIPAILQAKYEEHGRLSFGAPEVLETTELLRRARQMAGRP